MGVLRNVHDTPLGWVPSRELRDSGEARAGLGSRAHMRQLNPQLGGNADGWSVHTRGRTGTDAPATDVVAGVGRGSPGWRCHTPCGGSAGSFRPLKSSIPPNFDMA